MMKYYIGKLKDGRYAVFRHSSYGLSRATQKLFLAKSDAQRWIRNHILTKGY